MLSLWERIIFLIVLGVSAYFTYRNFSLAVAAIRRGKAENRKLNIWWGIQAFFLQKPIFKARPITSIFHSFVMTAFILYALVNLQDVIAAFVPHFRIFGETPLQVAFDFATDILSLLALVGVVYFALRRYVFKDRRLTFRDNVMLHEKALPGIAKDSAIVLAFIFTHVLFRVLHVAASMEEPYAAMPFASAFFPLVGNNALLEHLFWWIGIGVILAFFPYFPFSKHVHLFFAPVKWSVRRDKPYAYLPPMNLMEMMEKEEEFEEMKLGALEIQDLPWAQIMDSYACIMCNRCQDVCPAYNTGKPLSPSALIINMRYELNTNLKEFASGGSVRPLTEFAISDEALWSCTTCGACVEICPVGNEQLYTILQIRRGKVLMMGEDGGLGQAYRGMENQGNPWNMPASDREKWLEGLDVILAREGKEYDVLYWGGCAAAYDERYSKTARTIVELMRKAGLRVAVLGNEESCTGDSARRGGNELLFEMLATQNVETLNRYKPKIIVASCPHCYHTIKNEYPDFGLSPDIQVYHHSEFLAKLLSEGKLKVKRADKLLTFHDPCYLGRHNGKYDEPRITLNFVAKMAEPERTKAGAFCCGAGGGRMWLEEKIGKAINVERTEELLRTGAEEIAVACPFCMTMITDGVKTKGKEPTMVKDIAEIIAENLEA
ncbi:MAG: 4Fe-4S dicluster domain-containing protein [Thermotogae bacterium]|nr:4Fe-4S dicluster domain-containing protein [Thermotogota bacterium]